MKNLTVFFATITVSVSVLSLPAQAARIGQGTDLTQNPLNVNNTPNGHHILLNFHVTTKFYCTKFTSLFDGIILK